MSVKDFAIRMSALIKNNLGPEVLKQSQKFEKQIDKWFEPLSFLADDIRFVYFY